MISSPTATDILAGLDVSSLEDLSAEQKRVIVVLLARAAERSYRRGVQQGATMAGDDRFARPLHDWRYGPGTDASPWADSNRVETAVERLMTENRGLRVLGFPTEVINAGTVNVDEIVERLRSAAAEYQRAWSAKRSDDRKVMMASADIRAIGIEAYTLGGGQAVADLLDELVERYGWEAAQGVTSAFTGIGGWSA